MVLGQTEHLQTIGSSLVIDKQSAIHISVYIRGVRIYVYIYTHLKKIRFTLLLFFSRLHLPMSLKKQASFSNEDFSWVCLNYSND